MKLERTPGCRRRDVIPAFLAIALLPVLGGLATASEDLPSGTVFPSPGAQQKVKTYQALSRTILKEKLTGLVEETTEGEVFLGTQWVRHCNAALGALAALKKERAIPDSLNKWYASEQKAWLNIRTIGAEMLDHHYLMATTHEEIAQDAEDCEAFFKFFKDRATKANEEVGQVNDIIKAINAATGEFDEIKGLVGDFSKELGDLQKHFDVISRILRVFRARKFEFIKKKDLEGPYRDKLTKLKSKKLDPDATGTFYTYEKKWEETMQRTYQKYVAAVAAWKKANRWWWTPDELRHIIFTLAAKAVKLSAESVLGFPLPSTALADPEKLGDWILKMRETLTKVAEKARGIEFERINAAMLDREEQINQAYATFVEEKKALDMEARMKKAGVEEKYEEKLKALERESEAAHEQLGKAGNDKQQEESAWKKIRKIEAQMITEERACQKECHYWLETWQNEELEKAFDKCEKEVKKLRAELKELDGQMSR